MKRHNDNGERMAFAMITQSAESRRLRIAEGINAALNLINEESQSPLATPATRSGEFVMAPAFADIDTSNLPTS